MITLTAEQKKRAKLTYAMSGIGLLAGVFLASKQKKGAWGYIGYAIGMSIVGTVAGNVVGVLTIKDAPKATEPKQEI